MEFDFSYNDLSGAMMARYLQAINSSDPLPAETKSLFVDLLELMRQNRAKLNMTDAEMVADTMPAIEEGARRLAAYLPELHKGIRDLWLSDVKLFCVSELPNETLMWAHYANDHKGVVLQLNCIEEIDNMLCAAVPVKYQDAPPALATLDEYVEGHFIGKSLGPQDVWDKLFYTKQTKWSYEREWRVVLMGEGKGENFADMKFDPRELGGIMFGSRISEDDRREISGIIQQGYKHTKLWQATLDPKSYGVVMEPIA